MKHEYRGLALTFEGEELTQGHAEWLSQVVAGILGAALDIPIPAMLAAAEAGEGKGRPPGEIELFLECRRWNKLPREGGLLDQPAGLLTRMRVLTEIWQAFVLWSGREPGKEDAFAEQYPSQWKVIQEVLKLRG